MASARTSPKPSKVEVRQKARIAHNRVQAPEILQKKYFEVQLMCHFFQHAGILAVAYNIQMPSGKFFFKNFPNTEQAVYSFRCVIKPADE